MLNIIASQKVLKKHTAHTIDGIAYELIITIQNLEWQMHINVYIGKIQSSTSKNKCETTKEKRKFF